MLCYLLTILIVENTEITFAFKDDNTRLHSLLWTELLTLDKVRFESVEDLVEGTPVLSPWYNADPTDIQFADGVVTNRKRELIIILQCQHLYKCNWPNFRLWSTNTIITSSLLFC